MCEDDLRCRLRRVDRLIEKLAATRRSEIERVHHLRTEVRRSNVIFRLLIDDLTDRRSQTLSRKIDRVRKCAGDVRDLDVLRPLLRSESERLPAHVMMWLLHRLNDQRAQAAHQLTAQCAKQENQGISQRIRRCKRQLSRSKHSEDASSRLIQTAFRGSIVEFMTLARIARTDAKPLHPLRKAIRNTRYAVEALHDCWSSSTAKIVEAELATFQDQLGAANDLTALVLFLRTQLDDTTESALIQPITSLVHRLEVAQARSAQVAVRQVCQRTAMLSSALGSLIHRLPQ